MLLVNSRDRASHFNTCISLSLPDTISEFGGLKAKPQSHLGFASQGMVASALTCVHTTLLHDTQRMDYVPVAKLGDKFGKQHGKLVARKNVVEWHKHGFVNRKFEMQSSVVAAVFTRYAHCAAPNELWAVIVCSNRLVHSFGLDSGTKHVAGISFVPKNVVACDKTGIVFTSVSKTLGHLDVFMLQGPEELPGTVVPSSVSAPLNEKDELVFCDENFAVVWNGLSHNMRAYNLRLLQHQHAQTSNLSSTDSANKAAVILPIREWTQSAMGRVFSQRLWTAHGPISLVASHDPEAKTLYVLCGPELLQHNYVDYVSPVKGTHLFPGTVIVSNFVAKRAQEPAQEGDPISRISYTCLFFPHISPLRVPYRPQGVLTGLDSEEVANWFEVAIGKATQRFSLAVAMHAVIEKCFDIIVEVLGPSQSWRWLTCFLANKGRTTDEMAAFMASFVIMSRTTNPNAIAQLVVLLHVLREELSLLSMYPRHVQRLGELLKKCVRGWGPEWEAIYSEYEPYMLGPEFAIPHVRVRPRRPAKRAPRRPHERASAQASKQVSEQLMNADLDLPCISGTPPSIFDALYYFVNPQPGQTAPNVPGNERVFPTIHLVLALFQLLATSTSHDEIRGFLLEKDVVPKIHMFTPGLRACIMEVANLVHLDTETSKQQVTSSALKPGGTDEPESSRKGARGRASGVDETAKRDKIVRGLFRDDLRYTEALRFLQTKDPQKCYYGVYVNPENIPDHSIVRVQKEWGEALASRALATAFGRAALEFASKRPLLWEQFEPVAIDFSGECTETALSIPPVYKSLAAAGTANPWGVFAHGTALGLAVISQASGIDSLWVITSAHLNFASKDLYSGFVYGMGLSGHLAALEDWQFYESLVSSNSRGTLAALLGVAASKIASKDAKLTKVLSVHIRALLPVEAHSSQLVPEEVEWAALVSLGLLYLGQGVRHLSEVLSRDLEQVSPKRSDIMPSEDRSGDLMEHNEAYKLAVGISLGLINCGMGTASGLGKLLPIVTSLHDRSVYASEAVNGTLCAILLAFTGSNDELVASQLKLPHTRTAADYSSPQGFFARALTYHLVLWDDVQTSKTWILANVPDNIRPADGDAQSLRMDGLWYQHALAGVMTAVAMRNVASNDTQIIDTLLELIETRFYEPYIANLGAVMGLLRPQNPDAYERRDLDYDLIQATKHLASLLSSLALAMGAVAAGSGNLAVLRLLRKLWQVSPQVQDSVASNSGDEYATKLGLDLGCVSQAIGWLFMGGSQRSFKTDPQSVSVLCCFSFLNLLGGANISMDQWQHLRFLWSVLTERRCLYAKHDPSDDVVVELKLKNKPEPDRGHLPLMLPPLDSIEAIHVCDDRYVHESITPETLGPVCEHGVALIPKETGRHTLESMLPLSKPKPNADSLSVRILRAKLQAAARKPGRLSEQQDLQLLMQFSETWPLDDDSRLFKKRDIEQLRFLQYYSALKANDGTNGTTRHAHERATGESTQEF